MLPTQELTMWSWRKTDRPCEPADANLVHEIGEALTRLQLVLA